MYVLYCIVELSAFELQSDYYIFLWIKIFREGMNLLNLLAMG